MSHFSVRVGLFLFFGVKVKRTVDLGVLYSSSGTYAAISQAVLRGTLAGVEEINADPSNPIRFQPIVRDPKGEDSVSVSVSRARSPWIRN